MEQIRSFVAIELSDQLKQELREPQALLKSKGITDQIRWVKPEGLHLTLKFLGNVPADEVKEIVVAISQARLGVEPGWEEKRNPSLVCRQTSRIASRSWDIPPRNVSILLI
jgi:hypothetical protein